MPDMRQESLNKTNLTRYKEVSMKEQDYMRLHVKNEAKLALPDLEADEIKAITVQLGYGKVEHWDRNANEWRQKYNGATLNPNAIYRTRNQ